MSRSFLLLAAIAAIALGGLATPALADFSACDAGLRTSDPHQKIDLYTICLTKGGLVATDRAGAFNNRGVAYEQLGQFDQAFEDFDSAVQNDPNWGTFRLNRASMYARRRQWALAEADLTEALRESPSEPRAREFELRGRIRLQQARYKEAVSDFDEALSRDHKSAGLYNAEAWLLATCPDASVRNGAKAVQLAQAAVKLDDAPGYHDTLAAAFAEAGRYDDAVREQSAAIDLAKAKAPGRDFGDWADRLELYRKGTAFHESPPSAPAAG